MNIADKSTMTKTMTSNLMKTIMIITVMNHVPNKTINKTKSLKHHKNYDDKDKPKITMSNNAMTKLLRRNY